MSEPTAAELECRRTKIGLTFPELARLSDVHPDTAFRHLSRGRDILPRTKKALIRGLEAHELALRDYLLALHPLAEEAPARPSGAARPELVRSAA